MTDYLPQEVIIEILTKLPIKSIVRCTCVCTSWLSLIKSPSFISNHLSRTITSTTKDPLLLFRHCVPIPIEKKNERSYIEHYCLGFDSQKFNHYKHFGPPVESSNSCYHVVSSCNGLICLSEDLYPYTNIIILWNPLIDKFLTLPTPIFTFWTYGPHDAFTGFGFDSRSNDYKVVRMVNLQEFEDAEEPATEVEIFSLNANSWKSITNIAPKYKIVDDSPQAFVNGVVHWIAFRKMRDINEFSNVVLGLDMGHEVFHEIMLPECLVHVPPMELLYVWVYGESSIAVSKIDYVDYRPVMHHIWVMKDYGVVGSWTKILILGEQDGRLSKPLGFRKNGEVLLEVFPGKIASCDPESQHIRVLRDLQTHEEMMYIFVATYVESLVLLNKENVATGADIASDASDVCDPSDASATEVKDAGYAVANVNYDAINASDAIDNSRDTSIEELMEIMQMLEFMDRL